MASSSNPIHASPLESGTAKLAASPDGEAMAEAEADGVIEAIGASYWQHALTFVMSVLFAADAVEVSLLSFLYECVGAAFDLSTVRASSVVSIVFAGMVVGALGAGSTADQVGRKAISLGSILCVAGFGFLSAFAANFDQFVALRFCVGVFIGTFAVPFDLLAEMVPARTRGRVLVWMQVGWALGAMYACAAACGDDANGGGDAEDPPPGGLAALLDRAADDADARRDPVLARIRRRSLELEKSFRSTESTRALDATP